jgi:pilus assembly protein Flp/PilA
MLRLPGVLHERDAEQKRTSQYSAEPLGKTAQSHMTNHAKESKMKTQVMKFLQDEEGLTIVEYAVAAGLISAAVVASFTLLGTTVDGVIQALITAINTN